MLKQISYLHLPILQTPNFSILLFELGNYKFATAHPQRS